MIKIESAPSNVNPNGHVTVKGKTSDCGATKHTIQVNGSTITGNWNCDSGSGEFTLTFNAPACDPPPAPNIIVVTVRLGQDSDSADININCPDACYV